MYQFSQRFKLTTYVLMALGLLGLAYGFLSAPSTVEEAKAMVAAHDSAGHGSAHAEDAAHGSADTHATESHAQPAEHGEMASTLRTTTPLTINTFLIRCATAPGQPFM